MSFVDPALPTYLMGDEGRLRQVLINLTGNAVKFTDRGSVVISAVCKEISASNARVEFSVKDSGPGLTPEAQERIFQPFRQVDGSSSRRHPGTGLGLSISRQLALLMGGNIRVESRLGEGATFTFEVHLPISPAREEVRRRPSSPMRVLVVDDDSVSCDILAQYLTSWSIEHECLMDPREALDRLKLAHESGQGFDVVIVDLLMPHVNGFALAESIRREPRFRDVRLLLVTAFDEPGQAEHAIKTGFSSYLCKPVRQSEFYDFLIGAKALPGDEAFVPPDGAVPANGGLRMLVAEDNAVNLQLALRQLEVLGYSAKAVRNGSEALAEACAREYDLILMDCQMPEMDGFEATREIRKAESGLGRRTRIVAMTANAMSTDRIACFEAGMDGFLTKPVTIKRLQEVLEAQAEHLA